MGPKKKKKGFESSVWDEDAEGPDLKDEEDFGCGSCEN